MLVCKIVLFWKIVVVRLVMLVLMICCEWVVEGLVNFLMVMIVFLFVYLMFDFWCVLLSLLVFVLVLNLKFGVRICFISSEYVMVLSMLLIVFIIWFLFVLGLVIKLVNCVWFLLGVLWVVCLMIWIILVNELW